MKVTRRFTVLGCSSSPGVPRIGGDWGACDPSNPKNRRSRAAFLVEQFTNDGGRTTVAIDTGPDFREQMLRADVNSLDAVVYTHSHADHIHGIDDLRGFALMKRRQIPVYADQETMNRIRGGFEYCFSTPKGSSYPPIVKPNIISDFGEELVIEGEGGPIPFLPLAQQHGSIISLGFRIGDLAYCSDVSDFPSATIAKMNALNTLIIDALQYKFHPSHLSLEQALDWIAKFAPMRAYLTHMHTPLDYETVRQETPDHVEPSYDGLTIEFELDL